MLSPKTFTYGVFDRDIDFDWHEWSCSHLDRSQNIKRLERIDLTQLEWYGNFDQIRAF